MKERPILFSKPMVLAILSGTKTQTRRVVKPSHLAQIDLSRGGSIANWSKPMPYGRPGDQLWVRETWMPDPPRDGTWPHVAFDGCGPRDMSLIPGDYRKAKHCLYRADGHEGLHGWTPAIHMFRWASRPHHAGRDWCARRAHTRTSARPMR